MHRIGTVGRQWWRWVRDSKAVSALEYAILVGILAVAIAAALNTFSGDLDTAIEGIGNKVAGTGAAAQAPDMAPPATTN